MIKKWKVDNHFNLTSNAISCQQSILLDKEKQKDLDILLTNIPNIQALPEIQHPGLSMPRYIYSVSEI